MQILCIQINDVDIFFISKIIKFFENQYFKVLRIKGTNVRF